MELREKAINRSVSSPPENPVGSGGAGQAPRGVLYRHFVEPFVRSANPPWFDARGVAVGLLIGMGCPVGAQMILLGALRLCFRFNSVIAFAFTWVLNPVTFVPLYYGYYRLGSIILDEPATISLQAFRDLMLPLNRTAYFWEALKEFVSLGGEFVVRWALAAGLVSFVFAIAGYLVAYGFQKARCMRRARTLGISYEKVVEDLEKRLTAKT